MILGRHGVFSQNNSAVTFDYVKEYSVNAVQIFTKPLQQCIGREFTNGELDKWTCSRTDCYIYAHTGYFINIASGLHKSKFALLHEARRCSKFSINTLIVHPRSSLGKSLDEGIELAV